MISSIWHTKTLLLQLASNNPITSIHLIFHIGLDRFVLIHFKVLSRSDMFYLMQAKTKTTPTHKYTKRNNWCWKEILLRFWYLFSKQKKQKPRRQTMKQATGQTKWKYVSNQYIKNDTKLFIEWKMKLHFVEANLDNTLSSERNCCILVLIYHTHTAINVIKPFFMPLFMYTIWKMNL